jgi:ABC-type nickel/cobalt efflux system permease component RcnA
MTELLFSILLHADHHHHDIGVHAPIVIGLLASFMHVVSGPDHLAAVTPLAIDNKLKAWIIGLGWGAGHTLGMLLIGLLFILFRNFLPIEAISEYGEAVVGAVLIAIGAWAFWKIFRKPSHHSHAHPHTHHDEHGTYTHVHEHGHPQTNVHRHMHPKAVRQSFFTAIFIGVIHGLAGVSHLVGMLPTLAFPTVFDSGMYLTGYGLGTITAMVVFSFALGFVAWQSDEKFKPIIFKSIQFAGASLSVVVGLFWMYQFV